MTEIQNPKQRQSFLNRFGMFSISWRLSKKPIFLEVIEKLCGAASRPCNRR